MRRDGQPLGFLLGGRRDAIFILRESIACRPIANQRPQDHGPNAIGPTSHYVVGLFVFLNFFL